MSAFRRRRNSKPPTDSIYVMLQLVSRAVLYVCMWRVVVDAFLQRSWLCHGIVAVVLSLNLVQSIVVQSILMFYVIFGCMSCSFWTCFIYLFLYFSGMCSTKPLYSPKLITLILYIRICYLWLPWFVWGLFKQSLNQISYAHQFPWSVTQVTSVEVGYWSCCNILLFFFLCPAISCHGSLPVLHLSLGCQGRDLAYQGRQCHCSACFVNNTFKL